MIINLIGQPGAGKTTIAKELIAVLESKDVKTINIDGDELREIFKNKDFSENGRRANIQNAYNIARFLEHVGYIPVLSLVSPYLDLRENLKDQTCVKEFYVKTSDVRGREHFHVEGYQEPIENFVLLDTTGKTEEEMTKIILEKL